MSDKLYGLTHRHTLNLVAEGGAHIDLFYQLLHFNSIMLSQK